MNPDTSYSRAFTMSKDLGVINRVTFRWKYSRSIGDPGGLIFHRFLYLKGITVVNGKDEVK